MHASGWIIKSLELPQQRYKHQPRTSSPRGEDQCPGDHSGVKRTSRSWLLASLEKLFCQQDGSHCIRPTGVERQMSDNLDQLLLFDAVLHGFAEMESQLVRAVQSN